MAGITVVTDSVPDGGVTKAGALGLQLLACETQDEAWALLLADLPTEDPGEAGAPWLDDGVLTVSDGGE